MAFIEIQNLFKRYKKVVAVNHINLGVEKGEMLTLLGPSGCGKTTTLRCIAGLERPEEGDIVIDGHPMLSKGYVPSSKRGIGMVFQNYAVWPHMKVFKNVVYGLKLQGVPKKEIGQRAEQVLGMVGLAGLEDRYPAQLSGGQQQRVALARAMVRNPKVLLMDEPLSNLDAKLREKMRFEIKGLVRRMGITAVYVTHDQAEAMVISDRIAVMNAGNVVQVGMPDQIYEQPSNQFVADFIGTMNFLEGTVAEILDPENKAYVTTRTGPRLLCSHAPGQKFEVGQTVQASIRPENVAVSGQGFEQGENLLQGRVAHKAFLGNFLYLFVESGETMIRVQAPQDLELKEGDAAHLNLNPDKLMILA